MSDHQPAEALTIAAVAEMLRNPDGTDGARTHRNLTDDTNWLAVIDAYFRSTGERLTWPKSRCKPEGPDRRATQRHHAR